MTTWLLLACGLLWALQAGAAAALAEARGWDRGEAGLLMIVALMVGPALLLWIALDPMFDLRENGDEK